jgi:hypothetical protein
MKPELVTARKTSTCEVYLSYSVVWVVTQRRLAKNRRFGTTYRFHLLPLKMEPVGSPETSVLSQPTLRNKPEHGRIEDLYRSLGMPN